MAMAVCAALTLAAGGNRQMATGLRVLHCTTAFLSVF